MAFASLTFKFSLVILSCVVVAAAAGNFTEDFEGIPNGPPGEEIINNGEALALHTVGSGFQSKDEYFYCKVDMEIKFSGNSSDTGFVTKYSLTSEISFLSYDDIIMTFTPDPLADPYILETSLITRGNGFKQQKIYLWFDPTADFHTYSIIWNSLNILFFVDGKAYREIKNLESEGVPYPNQLPLRLTSQLRNNDRWYPNPDFGVTFRNFRVDACTSADKCVGKNVTESGWIFQVLDEQEKKDMKELHNQYLIYDYCTDPNAYPTPFPRECAYDI